MYRVKDSASVRDLSYSKLRGREVELEVVLHRNRVCGVVVAKVIGAVWKPTCRCRGETGLMPCCRSLNSIVPAPSCRRQ